MANTLSLADQELVRALGAEGIHVSGDMLVGWRRHGLLPRTNARRLRGGGSSVDPHTPNVFAMAACLAHAIGRGGYWQRGGLALFEEDLPISEPVMRECLLWHLRAGVASATRVWAEAASSMPPTVGTLSPEQLGDIAALAAELARKHKATRSFRSQVEADFRRLGYFGSDRAALRLAVNEAAGLRLAVLAGAGPLPPDLDDVARYGRANPPPAGFPVVLMHERLACAQTLTLREAYVAGRINRVVIELDETYAHLRDAWLLEVAAIDITTHRMANPPYAPDVPLNTGAIRSLEEQARDLEVEADRADQELHGQDVLDLEFNE